MAVSRDPRGLVLKRLTVEPGRDTSGFSPMLTVSGPLLSSCPRLMPDLAGWRRRPGWSWTVRHERATSAGYGVATLLAGGALGVVPSLVTGDWQSLLTWVLLWTCIGLTVIAAACLTFSEWMRHGRNRVRRENGTAYLVFESARFWTPQDVTRFWQGIRRHFARVVQVPGPRELARGWDWSLDSEAARDWDGKVNELVRAFQVLNRDESRNGAATANSVFIWAWWAVATAFGMRVAAADRGLDLNVWQRPSRAREVDVYPEIWSQRPLRFATTVPGVSLPHELNEHVWQAKLTVSRWGRARPGANSAPVSVLLVRFNSNEWGPIPKIAASSPGNRLLSLKLHDAAGVVPAGGSQTEVHELRCIPPAQGFAWNVYPALAAEAAAWIEKKSEQLAGHTLLLGTLMPQEISLALGILAGQPERRSRWPVHVWPIIAEPVNYDLVIPHMDLGSASVDPALADGKGA
jgi:hypothetical protein